MKKLKSVPASGDGGAARIGFWGLTAIVFGMMVGAGIFNLPQNMAAGAGVGAVAIAWIITAVGMLLLVATFKTLADRRPDLDAGIYQYAQEGWGNYIGFNVAWGYWLCASFANVAYAVMLYECFAAFFPPLISSGVGLVVFGTVFIWTIYFIVCRGIRTVKVVNSVMSALKVAVILLIIGLIAANVKVGTLDADILCLDSGCGDLLAQVRSTMLVTLWCFIGIEGAVMLSGRARRSKDVGRAGVTGFFISWLLYLLVSVLCYGVMSRARLAGLDNPSAAYLLRAICGGWAYWLVIIAVIVSLLGGWIAWTIICAQVPYKAASVGIFPRRFLHENGHGIPSSGLLVSSIIMQLFIFIVACAEDMYLEALSITGMMILPAYLLSGAFLWKATRRPALLRDPSRSKLRRFRLTGIACTLYCLWMIYAGGLELFAGSSVFYLFGLGFFIKARREQRKLSEEGLPYFTRREMLLLAALVVCTAVTLFLL